jgi:hypothetical protein
VFNWRGGGHVAGARLVMRWIIGSVVALYVVGAGGYSHFTRRCPVTVSLAVARSFLWPLWITTGRAHGEQMRMD